MRALLVAPRLPGTGYSGDRLRTLLHLDALAAAGFETVLVGGVPRSGMKLPSHAVSAVYPVSVDPWRMPFSLASSWMNGFPLQAAVHAGGWRDALRQAGGGFDLVVWILVRQWAHFMGDLPAGRVVVDYVDSLSGAADEAAKRDPAAWRRLYWRLEADRLRRAEASAATRAAATLAAGREDAERLPKGTRAIFHGVEVREAPAYGSRPSKVAFTGRLAYRPNEIAATWLAREVWPKVRALCPDAELLLAGADAPRSIRRLDGIAGVRVLSPVVDMAELLRGVRVACLPVSMGAGVPNKLFEAFEAGAAVVASREVIARSVLLEQTPPAREATTAEEFAQAVASYLRDPESASRDGCLGRSFVERCADRRNAVRELTALYKSLMEAPA